MTVQGRYMRKTKAELVTLLMNCQDQLVDAKDECGKLERGLQHAYTVVANLEKDKDRLKQRHMQKEYDMQHALQSVVDGIKSTLTNSNKLYHADPNAYYALFYWVEWGSKEARHHRTTQATAEDGRLAVNIGGTGKSQILKEFLRIAEETPSPEDLGFTKEDTMQDVYDNLPEEEEGPDLVTMDISYAKLEEVTKDVADELDHVKFRLYEGDDSPEKIAADVVAIVVNSLQAKED